MLYSRYSADRPKEKTTLTERLLCAAGVMDEIGSVEPGELRAAMQLVLPMLLQGVVDWAGRENAQLTGRPGALCEKTLRLVCAWSRAERS